MEWIFFTLALQGAGNKCSRILKIRDRCTLRNRLQLQHLLKRSYALWFLDFRDDASRYQIICIDQDDMINMDTGMRDPVEEVHEYSQERSITYPSTNPQGMLRIICVHSSNCVLARIAENPNIKRLCSIVNPSKLV